MDRVYLDYAATTPLSTDVYKEMLRCFQDVNGNSSSLHSFGRSASEVLEKARTTVAKTINAKSNEIYFTSGGTEANNWALFGIARANRDKGNHIIISAFEHPSIIESAKRLQEEGFEVSYAPITKDGLVNYKEIVKMIVIKGKIVNIVVR